MHPLVRDLYKRFLLAGRDYPQGIDYIRGKAKASIFKNALLTEEVDIKRAVSKGRYWVREIQAITKLKKYRYLKNTHFRDQE
jgi:hypothetical protein